MKAPPTKGEGADVERAINNEMLHWHEVAGKHKAQVLKFQIFVKQKTDGNINAQKVIGGEKQRNHVPKEDVSSTRVLEEAVMPTCTQEKRDAAVASIPNALVSDSDK